MSCVNLQPPSSRPSWYSYPLLFPSSTTLQEIKCMGINTNNTDMTLDQWANVWNSKSADLRTCSQVFNDIVYSGTHRSFSSFGFNRVKSDFKYMITKYFNNTSTGHTIALEGASNWTAFQTILIKACSSVPGACQDLQPSMCSSCSRNEISNNPDLLRFCGCFAPGLDPTIYRRNIDTVCDPLCTQSEVSKLVTSSNGQIQECQDTICVMDDVSINASDSLLSGVNITQVCPGCTASTGCKCIVDVSVENIGEKLGINNYSVFQQYCPPEFSTCIEINSLTQTSTVVPCATKLEASSVQQNYNSKVSWSVYIFMGFVCLIVILALVAYYESSLLTRFEYPRPFEARGKFPVLKGKKINSRNFHD